MNTTNKKQVENIKNSNNNKNNNTGKILILNKIKHFPALILDIFPFVASRPLILSDLIGNDFALKTKIKKTIRTINKKNYNSETNDFLDKFVVYKLIEGIDINYFISEIRCLFNNYKYYNNSIKHLSCIDNYYRFCIEYFKKNINLKAINIKYNTILNNIPTKQTLKNLIKDSKEIVLFYLPLKYKDYTNNDSLYLSNLNKNRKETSQKINLFCIIKDKNYDANIPNLDYENINKIFFSYNDDIFNNIFHRISLYLYGITHRENIESIIFEKTFFKENESENIIDKTKNVYIYNKIMVEYLIDNYYEKINKKENINLNLKSLEKIEFDDSNIINTIQRFRLRYNLNKIFSYKAWCQLIIITPEDFNDIYNFNEKQQNNLMIKMNRFSNENNNYKMLYLDFNNNSPYQKNFFYFCEKYLNLNKNINIIIIDNIGDINKDYEYIKKAQTLSKIQLPSLENIIFEKEITSVIFDDIHIEKNQELPYVLNNGFNYMNANFNNNINSNEQPFYYDQFGIKSFINEFFDYSDTFFIYEGFGDNNNLIYYNIVKKLEIGNELYRIFFIENKISKMNFIKENIEINYNKNENKLRIINKNKHKYRQLKDYDIHSFNQFINDIRINIEIKPKEK